MGKIRVIFYFKDKLEVRKEIENTEENKKKLKETLTSVMAAFKGPYTGSVTIGGLTVRLDQLVAIDCIEI